MTVRIIEGDCRAIMRTLDPESVHCVVTSVPYWGLRSYGTEPQIWGGDAGCEHQWSDEIPGDGRRGQRGTTSQFADRGVSEPQVAGRQAGRGCWCACGAWRGEHGLEPRLDMWLANEVEIWREVRRVLRKDGVAWLNCGDAYASSVNGRSAADTKALGNDDRTFRDKPISTVVGKLKPKDRLMLPARLAIALQDDGWWLRDEIVWHKPNPMPSSVEDRTTPAHEMVYLLSRSARYFFDAEAIREPDAGQDHRRNVVEPIDSSDGHLAPHSGIRTADGRNGTGRNKRSVWPIATEPFPGAHFATFPTELVKPMILAATSEKGCCATCGAPWARDMERPEQPADAYAKAERNVGGRADGFTTIGGQKEWDQYRPAVTIGWSPSCKCEQVYPLDRPVVLDPFGGAGTVGLVADRLQRDAILIELNGCYARMARNRVATDGGMFAQVAE